MGAAVLDPPAQKLQPLLVYAGTGVRRRGHQRSQVLQAATSGRLFVVTGYFICWNHGAGVLEPVYRDAGTAMGEAFDFAGTMHKFCYHRPSILLEPAIFSASTKFFGNFLLL